MTVDILIFAMVAAVILYRLYNMLGTHDDKNNVANNNNVITLPKSDIQIDNDVETDQEEQYIISKLTEEKQQALSQIKAKEKNFKINNFLKNSERAFELIIEAFVAGDKKSLNKLASDEIARNFIAEFDSLQKNNHKISINIVAVVKNTIQSINLNKDIATISIKFVTEQISIVTDKNDKVISGDKSKIEEIEDIWTFQKKLNTNSPVWVLCDTED